MVVRSLRAIIIFNFHNLIITKVEEGFSCVAKGNIDYTQQAARLSLYSGVTMSVAEIIVFVVTGLQVANGYITVGAMMAFISAYWKVVNSVTAFRDIAPSYASALTAYNRNKNFANDDGCTYTKRHGCHLRSDCAGKAISMSSVKCCYDGVVVFSNFDLSVSVGSKILIRGRNGSGKTTLFDIICGFTKPSSGILSLPDISRISSFTGQYGLLNATIREQLHAIEYSHLVDIGILARRLGIDDVLDKSFDELSIGQIKRAQILLSLTKDADVFLFDEPLSGIQESERSNVIDTIFDCCDGRTVLMVLHGGREYNDMFDEVVHLS